MVEVEDSEHAAIADLKTTHVDDGVSDDQIRADLVCICSLASSQLVYS